MNFTELSIKRDAGSEKEVLVAVDGPEIDALLDDFDRTIEAYRTSLNHGADQDEASNSVDSMLSQNVKELRRDFVLNRITSEALSILGITPALTPKIHALEYPQHGQSYSFELLAVERPEITLSSYEPVRFEMPVAEVTEKMIEDRIENELDKHATFHDSDPRPVNRGDFVKVDIVTESEGSVVSRLSGNSLVVDTGGASMPEPFLEGMVGMDVGEERLIEYSVPRPRAVLPDDVIVYRATVNLLSQQEKSSVTLSDAWVRAHYPQVSSVEEFREAVRNDTEIDVDAYNRNTKAHLANVAIEKRVQGTISDEFYQASYRRQMDKLEDDLAQQGKTLDDYYEKEQTNEEELSMKMLVQSGENLRQAFALEALFDGREMLLEVQDLKAAYRHLFGDGEYDEEGLRQSGKYHLIESAAKRIKALAWLVDTAEITPS